MKCDPASVCEPWASALALSLPCPGSLPTWDTTVTAVLALDCSLEQPPAAH